MSNSHYRCYFTDESDRIKGVEQIECGDDADAALKVQHLLTSCTYNAAELWQGARLVGKWANTGDFALQSEQPGSAREHAEISNRELALQSAK